MASATIGGSGTQSVGLSFDATANFALAQRIAEQINAGISAGTIVTSTDEAVSPLPPGVEGAYIQTVPGPVVLPPGYTSDNIKTDGPAVVFGSGQPDLKVLYDENTDLTFIATSGSGTVVAGGGANRL
jgi:hypothetical protein